MTDAAAHIQWLAERNAWLTRHVGHLEEHNGKLLRVLSTVSLIAASADKDVAREIVSIAERATEPQPSPIPRSTMLELLGGP